MFSPFLKLVLAVIFLILIVTRTQARELRACADPNNMPFSNMKQEGYENRIVAIVAKDRRAQLVYVWQRMGRRFVREYLGKSRWELLVGIPSNYRPVLKT